MGRAAVVVACAAMLAVAACGTRSRDDDVAAGDPLTPGATDGANAAQADMGDGTGNDSLNAMIQESAQETVAIDHATAMNNGD